VSSENADHSQAQAHCGNVDHCVPRSSLSLGIRPSPDTMVFDGRSRALTLVAKETPSHPITAAAPVPVVFVRARRTTLLHSGFLVTDFITWFMEISMADHSKGTTISLWKSPFELSPRGESRRVNWIDKPWPRPRHTHIWGVGRENDLGLDGGLSGRPAI
jgi:hypothetical protein